MRYALQFITNNLLNLIIYSMKKIFTLICLAMLPFFTTSAFAQDTIVAWTFPSTSADSLPDAGLSINSGRYISCQYGTYGTPSYHSIPSDYTTNGSLGSPDKCAKTTGWDNGADSAYYMVKFKTTGYNNILLYSKQQAGGSNPGPRDFKVQYKLSGTTVWNDLTGGILTCANDWTAALTGLALPASCDNQSSNISLRWLLTSNFDLNGGTLLSTGISKIDDIVVTGSVISGIQVPESESFISIYPNPNKGNFTIENNGEIKQISIYNILGKRVYNNENVSELKTDLSGFESGMYLVQITLNNSKVYTHKLIVE